LITEAMRQVVEFQPHAVLEIFFEHYAANSFGHGNPPCDERICFYLPIFYAFAADQAAAELIWASKDFLVAVRRSVMSVWRLAKRWLRSEEHTSELQSLAY